MRRVLAGRPLGGGFFFPTRRKSGLSCRMACAFPVFPPPTPPASGRGARLARKAPSGRGVGLLTPPSYPPSASCQGKGLHERSHSCAPVSRHGTAVYRAKMDGAGGKSKSTFPAFCVNLPNPYRIHRHPRANGHPASLALARAGFSQAGGESGFAVHGAFRPNFLCSACNQRGLVGTPPHFTAQPARYKASSRDSQERQRMGGSWLQLRGRDGSQTCHS